MRSGAHVDPLTRQFPAFRSTGRITWQFEKKTMHNGLTNEITFTHKEKKFILNPLPHSQVVRDQVQMKQKRDEEKKKQN